MIYRPIPNVHVYGITGYARHGKDTLALSMMAEDLRAERFAFSDAVASYARVLGLMGRRDPKVLQGVGWQVRQRNPQAWLDALYWAIDDRRPPMAIVTGVRFEDEAQMIRDMGGRMTLVVRTEDTGKPYVDPHRAHDHPVERQIPHILCDMEVVAQSGDLDVLRSWAPRVLA